MSVAWNKEFRARLSELHSTGMSFTDIAAALGHGITRNAAIGQARRLGLHKEKHNSPWAHAVAGKRAPRRKTQRKVREKQRAISSPSILPTPFEARTALATPLHISLLDLRSNQCRWPYGEGPYTFCGCATRPSEPYCKPHARLSINPAVIKQRAA